MAPIQKDKKIPTNSLWRAIHSSWRFGRLVVDFWLFATLILGGVAYYLGTRVVFVHQQPRSYLVLALDLNLTEDPLAEHSKIEYPEPIKSTIFRDPDYAYVMTVDLPDFDDVTLWVFGASAFKWCNSLDPANYNIQQDSESDLLDTVSNAEPRTDTLNFIRGHVFGVRVRKEPISHTSCTFLLEPQYETYTTKEIVFLDQIDIFSNYEHFHEWNVARGFRLKFDFSRMSSIEVSDRSTMSELSRDNLAVGWNQAPWNVVVRWREEERSQSRDLLLLIIGTLFGCASSTAIEWLKASRDRIQAMRRATH